MPTRPRSGHIGPALQDLIESSKNTWFQADPDQAGVYSLREDLMQCFIDAGLAMKANNIKMKVRSIRRALQRLGYQIEAVGVGRGYSIFSRGVRWMFPVHSVSSATLRPFSSLSSCVQCVACLKTPDVPPAEHRQCQRGHSLCEECFKRFHSPSRAKYTSKKFHWCPKPECESKVSGDGFRNLIVEQAFSSNVPVIRECPICLVDFREIEGCKIIQCKTGHCMCLPCYDAHYTSWSKKREENKKEDDLRCPECRDVLATQNVQETYRNKAAELLYAKMLI